MDQRKRVDGTGANNSGNASAAAEGQEQSAADYLKRHSVTLIMHDLLAVLLENRPADPIDFISDYFDHIAQGDAGDPIERCCRYIQLSKPGEYSVSYQHPCPVTCATTEWRKALRIQLTSLLRID